MKIDNKRNTYRLWLNRMITTLVFTVAILVIIFLPWFDQPGSWLSKYHVVILVALVYIALNLNNYFKRPSYVSYSDQGEMIVLRYYPLTLFTSRKNSIEIPKKQLVRFELTSDNLKIQVSRLIPKWRSLFWKCQRRPERMD